MSEPVYLVITKRMDDGLFLAEGVTEGITDAEVLELAAEDWYAVAETGTKQIIRGDPESRLAAATEALRLADALADAAERVLFWENDCFHETRIFAARFGVEPCRFEDSSIGIEAWHNANTYGLLTRAIAAFRESRKETTDAL